MLVTVSWLNDLRNELGVKGVSPLWDGGTGYYFWLDGAAGPFQLQLRDTKTQPVESGSQTVGIFAIKCYPRPESIVFAGFSEEERNLLRDSMFDDTGTPCFEAAHRIGPDLFVVGVLECAFGPTEDGATFILESADRMILRNSALANAPAKTVPLLRRDVPGWEMSFSLFDRIVSMWAAYSRLGPSLARLSEDEGFETIVDQRGSAVSTDSADSKILTLEVGFGAETLPVLEDREDADGRVIYEFSPDPKCAGHIESHTRGLPFLNPRWWTIPLTDYKCDKTSTCGCE